MRSIVYGIAPAEEAMGRRLPEGLQGAKISAAQAGRLAALLSPISEGWTPGPGVEETLAFARVVDELHRKMTLLPMRFGSLVRDREDAAAFLQLHERALCEALDAVAGCDEVGLRMLIRESAPERAPSSEAGAGEFDTSKAASEGVEYLQARRRYYEAQRRVEGESRAWAKRIESAFAGLFRDLKEEHSSLREGALLSLSFLVERSQTGALLRACQVLREETDAQVVCSGPWPVYSFAPDLAEATRETHLR